MKKRRKEDKLFYFIPDRFLKSIPKDLYSDNAIVLTYFGNWPKLEYRIETGSIPKRMDFFTQIYLHNLADEDFIHLNLMGVPIKVSSGVRIPELKHALTIKESTFSVKEFWKRDF